ncbi:nicotinate-nucleotide pyrophosphorylase [carboxylating] [Limimonas halophila]|uniref:Probable nicotinate-nucleotide pyrophosphorylase [carboxylating] n=1 Tax=Limimonas halophila TaxID=1082479 RepID=A0A1G7PVM9_9PROT|nr:carboxylating nicotinate-nucleotide diphosphorylase [Limimonas halophila]SDF90253.1 nicotinate-nucleotide pyrophosphorylase [carboxylating] [Limimonas halophila]
MIPPHLIAPAVRDALAEDLGHGGDLTSQAVVPAGTRVTATVAARAPGTLCGVPLAAESFRATDPGAQITVHRDDGDRVGAGDAILTVAGDARAVLAAERTALNFLGHLSGIATATAELVARVAPHGTRIAETRKTTPGLRGLEKAAVRAGGGHNHRFGLDDAVMIKDNHRALADPAEGLAALVDRARRRVGHTVTITVEVDTLTELDRVLPARPDIVLLDNMAPATLAEAVRRVAGCALTEASGGITRDTAAAVAATGVDVISVGWLTHSAPALDVGLDVTT